MTRRWLTQRQWWAVAAAATLAVVAGSLAPGQAASGLPAGADKLLHATGYATIAVAVAAALGARTTRVLVAVATAATLLGAGVELLQPTVGRTASLADGVANGLGAVVGALAVRVSRSR